MVMTILKGTGTLDSFELNKMAGAVLFCLLIVMGVKTVGEEVFAVHEPEEADHMGYDISGLVTETAAPQGQSAEPEKPLAVLLASADPEKGSRVFRRCTSCHTIEEGGDNKIGPNLWDIVGNHTAHKPDFAYSDAVKGASKQWTYENLNHWITNPADFIPGNKMAFAGLSKATDRADVIAYLAQNSPDAPPFPTPEADAAAPEAGAAAAPDAPASAPASNEGAATE
jgi:cytochrome c